MLCNRAADGIAYVVTAWLLLKLTGRVSSVAFQLTLTLLPSALLSPVVGVWTDRFSRRTILMAADLFQGALILFTVTLLLLDFQGVWYVYAMTVAVGISTLFHQIAARALLREIVRREDLLLGSSTISIASQTGALLGPVAGGLIAFHGSETVALASAGLLSVLGGLSVWRIPRGPAQARPASAGAWGWVADYRSGLAALAGNLAARRMFVSCLVFYVSVPFLNFLLPLLLLRQFQLEVTAFGLIDALFGIGSIAAGLALHAIEQRVGERRMMVGGVFVFGALIALFPASGHLAWLGIAYFLTGVFFHSGVTLMSELQGALSPQVQGRIMSLYNFLLSILATAAIQLSSVLLEAAVPVWWAYALYGAVLMGFALLCLLRWSPSPPPAVEASR
ncbi:MFS transporter [Aquabacterium sp. A7-Y]|nr:MFS transporter [Aquabacterium sp. A7-Y]MCW7539601.1 MFS transporter [Aquabacterium sp. A7-Y]